MKPGWLGATVVALGLTAAMPGPVAAQHPGDWHGGGGRPGGGGWHGGGGAWHGPHPWGPAEIGRWRGGGWQHSWHNGRFGWWWVVGPTWYSYPAPIYPYPSPYVPPAIPAPAGPMWYWCAAPAGYYPYVATCGGPWQPVQPH
jgi:hypothetical protein